MSQVRLNFTESDLGSTTQIIVVSIKVIHRKKKKKKSLNRDYRVKEVFLEIQKEETKVSVELGRRIEEV